MTDTPKRELSLAEMAQRQSASQIARQHATGPKTEAGKAASSRNAWKTGQYSAIQRQSFGLGASSMAKLFGKPCVTTCPYHPDNGERTVAPCSLVMDGITRAGGSCLDKTVYVTALTSLMDVMQSGDMDGMHGVLATEMASTLQLMHHIREEITRCGIMIEIPVVSKDGEVKINPNTDRPYIADVKPNPVLAHLIKLTETVGINFAELLATPRARERVREEDNAETGLQMLIGAIAQRAGVAPPKRSRTIEHQAGDGEVMG